MPPRRYRTKQPTKRGPQGVPRGGFKVAFTRRTVPMPQSSIMLRGGDGPDGSNGPWELICRDGWEWRREGAGVIVRVATLTPDQASVVSEWIDRIKSPAMWWAVTQELQSPESSVEVGRALDAYPWLSGVLPVLLEASTDGAPPPPPQRSADRNSA